MCPPVRRSLTLMDAMVLIAATAIGIAWARGGWDWMYVYRLGKNVALTAGWEPCDCAVRALPSGLRFATAARADFGGRQGLLWSFRLDLAKLRR